MQTRKTQYGWMALGGLLCLFGVVLSCKLYDGNRARAGDDPAPAAEKKPADAAKDKEEKPAETKKAEAPPKPADPPAPLNATMPMPEAPATKPDGPASPPVL